MQKRLKIGVIGTGHMGRNHVRNLSSEEKFDLVGIYDEDENVADSIASQYHTVKFNSVGNLLERVDAIVIAVPSTLHKEIAVEAARFRVNALVEKPLATTFEDAVAIINEFNENGVKLAAGHIERFNPIFIELKRLINPEEVVFIEACRYSPHDISARITDTSVVEDLMIHDIDLVCALMGDKEITAIHSKGEKIESDKIDFATCLIDFSSKAHAIINASRISQNKERFIKVHTRDSCFYANLLDKTLSIYKGSNLIVNLGNGNSYKQDGIIQKVYVPIEEPLRYELLAFYDYVVNELPIQNNGEIGARAVKICERVLRDI